MSNTIIKVEGLSKQYRLGVTGTGTLSHDLNRWWHVIRGKEDPYLKIGEENDRSLKGQSNYVWALRDVSFEVKQGDVLGIIGRNGAGKSTLLKILSRTTRPTIGSVKTKGRIASLLEVGTGFHPELSGRDNIFLNGAILGMTRKEIKKKFDEIISFAGVERYVDTPVKRYSSGMYVRLAFAIAAYLEPEILIVDEVLAVGDVEFQKKCIGKMNDVANNDGRTVLFVSHNIGVINQLCKSALLLKNGQLYSNGETRSVTKEYLSSQESNSGEVAFENRPSAKFSFTRIAILNNEEKVNDEIGVLNDFSVGLEYSLNEKVDDLELAIRFLTNDDVSVFTTCYSDCSDPESLKKTPGKYSIVVKLPGRFLMPGSYKITVAAYKANQEIYDFKDSILTFNVNETGSQFSKYGSQHRIIGVVMKDLAWEPAGFAKKQVIYE